MEIKKSSVNDVTTFRIEGWLDTNSAPQLGEALKDLGDTANLVFDFDTLEYISSSGIREVLSAYRLMRGRNGTFALINVSDEIMDVFSMTGLDKKLTIKGKEKA